MKRLLLLLLALWLSGCVSRSQMKDYGDAMYVEGHMSATQTCVHKLIETQEVFKEFAKEVETLQGNYDALEKAARAHAHDPACFCIHRDGLREALR